MKVEGWPFRLWLYYRCGRFLGWLDRRKRVGREAAALSREAPFTMTDEEKIARLRELSEAATPGPWIRRWASLDVQHMTGDDALTAQRDIDFAVHACAFVRELIQEIDDAQKRPAAATPALSTEETL